MLQSLATISTIIPAIRLTMVPVIVLSSSAKKTAALVSSSIWHGDEDGPRHARWAKCWRTMRDASSEPGCSRDQTHPCPDDDGPDGSRDALTGRCETFDGDGCRDDSHRAKVHDPDDEEDRHQTGPAVDAAEFEARAVSPGRFGVRRQRAEYFAFRG